MSRIDLHHSKAEVPEASSRAQLLEAKLESGIRKYNRHRTKENVLESLWKLSLITIPEDSLETETYYH